MQIQFNDFSHVNFHEMTENTSIVRIPKGTPYDSPIYGIFPKEDITKRPFEFLRFGYKCIAQKDRWRCGCDIYENVGDVEKSWNNLIMYAENTDKWFNKPYVELHFLDGCIQKIVFNNNDEAVKLISKYNLKNHLDLDSFE